MGSGFHSGQTQRACVILSGSVVTAKMVANSLNSLKKSKDKAVNRRRSFYHRESVKKFLLV